MMVPESTLKLHLGCGQNRLPGWENHDRDVDLRQPLPWHDGVAGFIFAEHVIEHLTAPQGLRLLEQCWRVLCPGGVLRLAFPDPIRIHQLTSLELRNYAAGLRRKRVKVSEAPEQEWRDCVRAVVCNWGHESVWTFDLALVLLGAVGFSDVGRRTYGHSTFAELDGIDGHHLVAPELARLETNIVEATK